MATEPPTGPDGTAPEPDTDTGRRNRRTRHYSDGFEGLDAHIPGPAASADPSGPLRPRLRPKSDTVVELPQDRAAVALPEVPDDLVVADAPAPKLRIAAHRSFGHDDGEATRTETHTATVTAVGPAPVSQRATAREIAAVRPPPTWQGPLALAIAAAAGALAAWLAFGRSPLPLAPVAPPVAVPLPAAAAVALVPPPAPVEPAAPSAAPLPSAPTPVAPPAPAAPVTPVAQIDPCADFDRAVVGTAGDPVSPYLALRRAPDETAAKIAELPDGARVRVLASHGRWRRVAVCKGQTGWVHGRWIASTQRGSP